MIRSSGLVMFCFAVSLVFGCGDEPGATSPCSEDRQCGPGAVCRHGECLPDFDNDGVEDIIDNCRSSYNPDQADQDGDGIGDVCDDDRDGDEILNEEDICPDDPDNSCDDDGDGIVDEEDNCPEVYNPDQTDTDHDSAGDACDEDRDGDGILNENDNCPDTYNPSQTDSDDDGLGDACDSDRDGDEIENASDNCPDVYNPDQTDTNHDGVGDACSDRDGDGITDLEDNCPDVPNVDQNDMDDDGVGDVCDSDRDGDDVPNHTDNCPDTYNPDQEDTDFDGHGDACDPDLVFRDDFPADPECEYTPTEGEFSPVIERSLIVADGDPWPTKNQIMSMPLVVNLTDDNDDEVVDENDYPEIVVITFDVVDDPDSYFPVRFGIVRAFDVQNEILLWTSDPGEVAIDAPSAPYGVMPLGTLAAGDIDQDGQVEIVAPAERGGLICFDRDGQREWGPTTDLVHSTFGWGGPAIADLDRDGQVEIVLANAVYDAHGVQLAVGPETAGTGENRSVGSLSAVADVVGDNHLDIILGNAVLEYHEESLTQAWPDPASPNERPDGFPAVADLNLDGIPEIVVTAEGHVYIYDGPTGALVWGPVDFTGEGNARLGPPTLANFDGEEDEDLEVGVASRGQYLVLDVDLANPTTVPEEALLWTTPTRDYSSSATGSSVFDFHGDGQAEVVYNDEFYTYAYDGATGVALIEFPNSSFTALEYPVIADVDNDGNAEIIVVGNDFVMPYETFNPDHLPGFHGVRVWASSSDNWAATRRIWNQHTYHITNVNEDGSIPDDEADNWEVYNNYRQNLPDVGGKELAAPDLVAQGDTPLDGGDFIVILAWISNQGATSVPPGLPVAFYRGGALPDPENLLGVVYTTLHLAPGQGERIALRIEEPCDVDFSVLIVADDDGTPSVTGTHRECDEENNVSSVEVICN